jgi:hypothetical protein
LNPDQANDRVEISEYPGQATDFQPIEIHLRIGHGIEMGGETEIRPESGVEFFGVENLLANSPEIPRSCQVIELQQRFPQLFGLIRPDDENELFVEGNAQEMGEPLPLRRPRQLHHHIELAVLQGHQRPVPWVFQRFQRQPGPVGQSPGQLDIHPSPFTFGVS